MNSQNGRPHCSTVIAWCCEERNDEDLGLRGAYIRIREPENGIKPLVARKACRSNKQSACILRLLSDTGRVAPTKYRRNLHTWLKSTPPHGGVRCTMTKSLKPPSGNRQSKLGIILISLSHTINTWCENAPSGVCGSEQTVDRDVNLWMSIAHITQSGHTVKLVSVMCRYSCTLQPGFQACSPEERHCCIYGHDHRNESIDKFQARADRLCIIHEWCLIAQQHDSCPMPRARPVAPSILNREISQPESVCNTPTEHSLEPDLVRVPRPPVIR